MLHKYGQRSAKDYEQLNPKKIQKNAFVALLLLFGFLNNSTLLFVFTFHAFPCMLYMVISNCWALPLAMKLTGLQGYFF